MTEDIERDDGFLKPAVCYVESISVECPCCEHKESFDYWSLSEEPDGTYQVRDEDRYQTCTGCKQLNDYGAITITAKHVGQVKKDA